LARAGKRQRKVLSTLTDHQVPKVAREKEEKNGKREKNNNIVVERF